jgi:hypothetical protein
MILKLESLLIFAFGIGIFVSKPLIYVASGGIIGLALLNLSLNASYRQIFFSDWLTWLCVALFGLGVLATVIHPGNAAEISWVARKSLYLLLLPVLYIAFQTLFNRVAGFAGAIVGFWVAALLTMQSMGWHWAGGRIAGATWQVDVWGVVTGLFVSFLLPSVFQANQSSLNRVLIGTTLLAAFAMMVMSGARGPWLGVAVGGLIYLVLFQQKVLLGLVVLVVALYFPVKQLLPQQITYLEQRVMSITNTGNLDDDTAKFSDSSWVRIQLWRVGIAQNLHKLENTPLTLLFGSGPKNQIYETLVFYDQWTGMPDTYKARLTAYGYPTNEMHNMYLDANGKLGLLWTIGSLVLIIVVVARGLRIRETHNQASLAVGLVSVNFLVTGLTYDILPHWGTFFLVFFTMLAIHAGNNTPSSTVQKVSH